MAQTSLLLRTRPHETSAFGSWLELACVSPERISVNSEVETPDAQWECRAH